MVIPLRPRMISSTSLLSSTPPPHLYSQMDTKRGLVLYSHPSVQTDVCMLVPGIFPISLSRFVEAGRSLSIFCRDVRDVQQAVDKVCGGGISVWRLAHLFSGCGSCAASHCGKRDTNYRI